MGQQYRAYRKVGSIPIVAGSFGTLDLPRQYDAESIFLRVAGTITTSAVATVVRNEAPSQLIRRVDVTADGKNLLFSAPFWYTASGNIHRKLTDALVADYVPPSGTAAAAYVVAAVGAIDFITVDGVRPKDSSFRTLNLSLYQIRLEFGQPSEAFTGLTNAQATVSGVVDVFVSDMVEFPDENGMLPAIPFLKKVSYQELAIATSNSNQDVRLPAGNLVREVLVRTDGGTVINEPGNATLNNLALQSGMDVRLNLTGAQIRAYNAANYGLVNIGYYLADLIGRGAGANSNLSELWDVRGAAEPKIFVDVTAGAVATKMQIVTTEYIRSTQ